MTVKFLKPFAYRLALAAFVAVWMISFAIETFPTFFPPKVYFSTAIIELEGIATNQALMQKQVEIIRSPVILKPVIEKLDLNKFWVQQSGLPSDFHLKTSELLEFFTNQLIVTVVSASTQIKIDSYSGNAAECALIANCVADTYRDVAAEDQIHVQIVGRAEPAVQPWKPGAATYGYVAVSAAALATICGVVAAVLAIFGMIFLRKFIAAQITNPVKPKHTLTPVTPKY
jgi:capsular polysaccharide biosynthesis protein